MIHFKRLGKDRDRDRDRGGDYPSKVLSRGDIYPRLFEVWSGTLDPYYVCGPVRGSLRRKADGSAGDEGSTPSRSTEEAEVEDEVTPLE